MDNKEGEILYFLRPGKISIDGMPCALGLEGWMDKWEITLQVGKSCKIIWSAKGAICMVEYIKHVEKYWNFTHVFMALCGIPRKTSLSGDDMERRGLKDIFVWA